MSDSNFDLCECIWGHDATMARLLNVIRNSQSYCTDEECIQDAPGPNGDMNAGGFGTMTMIMLGWMVVATALYFLRPSSLRRTLTEKPANRDNNNSNPDPPTPPPLC